MGRLRRRKTEIMCGKELEWVVCVLNSAVWPKKESKNRDPFGRDFFPFQANRLIAEGQDHRREKIHAVPRLPLCPPAPKKIGPLR